LFFTARIERPLLYRGGSASKKNGLPAPSHHSESMRSGSKEGLIDLPLRVISILYFNLKGRLIDPRLRATFSPAQP